MKKTNKLSLLPYFHTFSTNNSTTSIASARLSDNSNQYSYHKRSLIPSNSENIRSKNNTISNLHVNSNSLPNTQLSGSADRHKLTMTTESQNRRSISFTTTHTKSKSDLPLSTANKIPQPMRQKVTRISVSPTRSTTSLGYLSTHSYSKKPSLQYSCRESNTPTRSKTSMGALKSGIPILSRR
ncbi:uncharacterized protein BX663DRAFT_312629 [Cokeromyces recurvatus]|uniref:uncharacterized protein n=1 Tax=Cokeromyces recurvatus TaxID=90255 RepID=UPI002220B0A6|nr:uncharacterized protein BX663DRAFT_312629 [Cokeromyces recurvatus]KAI7905159.1 hypothetical protein BX663DRAFT_312629 [Cokeromyces recurvatus]